MIRATVWESGLNPGGRERRPDFVLSQLRNLGGGGGASVSPTENERVRQDELSVSGLRSL